MSDGQILSNSSRSRGLQPAPAWTAILGLFLFSALCIVAGAGKILNLAFPAGAFAVGAFLYFRYPILYVGFSWWVLFLTAFIRRLADYRGSFTDPSPILTAPYLVLGLTLITCWRYFPKVYRQGGLPFIVSFIGLFYSFLIGLINKQPAIVVRGALDWLTPVCFGFHLWVNWSNYPSYRQNLQRIFLWGVLVMGVYGVVQFVVAPEWDRLWLINTGLESSGGKAAPFEMRVFSTLNSAEPFSGFMAAALILLFNEKGVLNIFASAGGYMSLLLTTVRSAWMGWLAGLLTLISSMKAKSQMRLIITIAMIAVLVVPLTTIEPISQTISGRFNTLSSVEEDHSAQKRKETFQGNIGSALTNFIGDGIGGPGYDSSILLMLLHLGWFGTIPYMVGMLLLIFGLFQSSEGSFDPFTTASRAIVMSILVRTPVNNAVIGPSGVVLWAFLGMGMAAKKYYQHQRTARLSQPMPQNPP